MVVLGTLTGLSSKNSVHGEGYHMHWNQCIYLLLKKATTYLQVFVQIENRKLIEFLL